MTAEQKAQHVLDSLSGDYIHSTGTPVVLAEALEGIGWALLAVVRELAHIRIVLVGRSEQ